MKVKILLFSLIILLISCKNEVAETYLSKDDNLEILINDLEHHRKEYIRTYIEDRLELYKEYSSNSFIVFYKIIFLGKKNYANELNELKSNNSITEEYQTLEVEYVKLIGDMYKLSPAEIARIEQYTISESQIDEIATSIFIESNYKSSFSFVIDLIGDFILELIILFALFSLLILTATSFVAGPLLKFIFVNPIFIGFIFILSFFIKPLGWFSSGLNDHEKNKITEYVNYNTKQFSNTIKDIILDKNYEL